MALPVPQPGLVIRYSYLWHAEHEQGQEEGSKDRPCAIVLTYREEHGDTIVTVVPITLRPRIRIPGKPWKYPRQPSDVSVSMMTSPGLS